jgi:hypothetical protein
MPINDAQRKEIIKKARAIGGENPEKRQQIEANFAVAKPIIDELIELGYGVETLADLREQGKPWKTALPTLLRWLPKIDNPDIKSEVVRCLSVPWLGNTGTAQFIEDFRKWASINEMVAWTIGNALSIVDVNGFENQIVELCKNPTYGMTRQMLVLGLARFSNAEAEDTALELLKDESVKLQAVIAVGKMKSRRALPELERLLVDKKAIIRREAQKAITKIIHHP